MKRDLDVGVTTFSLANIKYISDYKAAYLPLLKKTSNNTIQKKKAAQRRRKNRQKLRENRLKSDEDRPKPGENRPKPGENRPKPGENRPKPGENQPKRGDNQSKGRIMAKRGRNKPKRRKGEVRRGTNKPKQGKNESDLRKNDPKRSENEPERGEGLDQLKQNESSDNDQMRASDTINWGERPGREWLKGKEKFSGNPNPVKKPFETYLDLSSFNGTKVPLLNLPPDRKRVPWPRDHPLYGLSLSPNQKNPEGGSMAACLLVKDDLDRLTEWIPYHYHFLPLRDVVIAIDPGNVENLTPLQDRWDRPEELGMTLSVWRDKNYLPSGFKPFPEISKEWSSVRITEVNANHHIDRQRFFFGACVEHMRSRNNTWTVMLDSDEYLVFNTPHGDDGTVQHEWMGPVTPSSDEKRLKRLPPHFHIKKSAWENRKMRMKEMRWDLPPNGGGVSEKTEDDVEDDNNELDNYTGRRTGGKTAMQYISEHTRDPPFNDVRPCIDVPRLFFGGIASKPLEVAADIPEGYDPTLFDTLRFRKHANRGAFEYNLYVKTLMDVSRFKVNNIPVEERPLGVQIVDFNTEPVRWWPKQTHKVCSASAFGDMPVFYDTSLFRAHHYIGTWERYSARDDKRRTRSMYNVKANVDKGSDDDIRPWLRNFVTEFGKYAAELVKKIN
eukprot:CAMPEP_0113328204 /NCGR_PEP_ID=MMETSP0010_2-20120614/19858_1 /TAXON_ID=216773 ORGANISM="Corethron hystrix, Strain 308" /NCGR_SAMPLE_ID=MMETSP0010_2 /ASSEMBLY_ACC=CAM_ASM_000155 /LENGTH=666 /DNA_ID=CAMNT_0000189443 /DNA_START=419 /DNA_END=2419 /DNA_ORIENTATION=+ /assembly_acc=CAM_ASM_000155